ncbi:MAG: addiction module antitoxin RelB [Candidatus Brocadia sp. AMX2]|uniref:Addiction module component n=1 Tax=Candidatus Brocadia sinica JPN1 TaxID=1197129 RepID=A0ABQ0K0G9_9BACT|nr:MULTISPECIES: addiction module protein [Brocadia]KXK24949.1 MAG: putative addiction module component [Candidatus Brocadia sinica]MBC6934192.1 addiction module antitoxin RelB [Candidatus Brocadia sp.]MBL1170775.1 addiction module antitoxin RelB [Candidatus Brocadia sp. AMX1]NOG42055.1 addiction module protein [Planctomycetota bacterium]KAA0240915.1 MAG: addiction module antitoxin RelB [Candidatus Brocadia sp. AMX2]
MVKNIDDIIDSILALPANSRAYLAELLLESLDFEEDFPISEEWMKEIKKRCQELDEGKVELISGNEGLAGLQKKYS